ncbi:NAD(P)H-dependent oxidoreductase [Paenarthrobacter sp. Z7-10]|uniref:NADPH-dependent FMN reductase n=1 Tax=Paenarthrobacter sp. Z7-10 TaxID=2787635 RepID=UPI0022A8E34D|nr:NAD(P)H-dependent oxidoreductase [Paenarthrobacter sp. Z7-10]MCZ2404805.1 NAD(P)H-dependent oxidoreductase [Paenarthrobacter sp. Z7-10]
MPVPKIAVILGSTRPGRLGKGVADWVYEHASQRADAEFEFIDLADQGLPLLDEPKPPMMGRYSNDHTKAWAATIARFDGYIFVTAEYNHSVPGALKNALDFLYAEWNDKACGFVSYGVACGTRAVEHLRLIAAELQMADVRAQVLLPFDRQFEGRDFTPNQGAIKSLTPLFDQVIAWAAALQPLRQATSAPE